MINNKTLPYENEMDEFTVLKDLILNSTNEIIANFDRDFQILWFNKAALNAAGLENQNDLIGRTCHDIWDKRDTPCPGCPVFLTLQDGQPHVLERQSSDGRYWLIRSVPLFDSQGKVHTATEFVIDITEKKSLEKQLIQSQKMESIGRLAGGLAHDFNNTLNIINGISEMALMKQERGISDFRNDFEEIKDAVTRSSELTKQLNMFARRQCIKPVNIDVNREITATVKLLNRLIGNHAELHWHPGEEIQLYMDPTQLERVITNLVINARDALKGTGKITVATEKREKSALIRVKDNGSGMDENTLSQIFEPFFSTKGEGKGSGLGLSTVYGIVQQNKGSISCESRPGKGTEFVIIFPLPASRHH